MKLHDVSENKYKLSLTYTTCRHEIFSELIKKKNSYLLPKQTENYLLQKKLNATDVH